jgi:hypothetical protein
MYALTLLYRKDNFLGVTSRTEKLHQTKSYHTYCNDHNRS